MSGDAEQRGPFFVTEDALQRLKTAAQANGLWRFGVRIRLVSVLNPSLGFDLSFEELPKRNDHVLKSRGLKLYVADDVLDNVEDLTTIDWKNRGFVFRKGKPTDADG